jgi:hypothetical protein
VSAAQSRSCDVAAVADVAGRKRKMQRIGILRDAVGNPTTDDDGPDEGMWNGRGWRSEEGWEDEGIWRRRLRVEEVGRARKGSMSRALSVEAAADSIRSGAADHARGTHARA